MLGPRLLRRLIQTRQIQPVDVRCVARANADAAGVVVDEIAALVCGLQDSREAEYSHDSRAPQRDARDLHAALLGDERDDLEQRDDQEDVACPVPRVLVIHDRLPDSRNALDRPVRVRS